MQPRVSPDTPPTNTDARASRVGLLDRVLPVLTVVAAAGVGILALISMRGNIPGDAPAPAHPSVRHVPVPDTLVTELSEVLVNELLHHTQQQTLTFHRFSDAGGIDPSTLEDPRQIQTRRAHLAETIRACEQSRRYYESLPDHARALARARALDEAQCMEFGRLVVQSTQPVLLARVCTLNIELMHLFDEYLAFMHEHHGKWFIHADAIVFRDDAFGHASGKHVALRERIELKRHALHEAKLLSEAP